MAGVNGPRAIGAASSATVDMAPADCPPTVTREGSPAARVRRLPGGAGWGGANLS